jgi:GntR family transcriptional repressor for pyruvate dehydrogenase complex
MKNQSVTNRIIASITQKIKDGEWKKGDRISSENELCQELSASRVSVRGALQHFIALGILKSYRGKGTFVINDDISAFEGTPDNHPGSPLNEISLKTPQTISEMKDLLRFRSLIEPEVCAAVAPTASAALIHHLEQLLSLMNRAIKDTNAFVNADMEFHMAICHAINNPILDSIMDEVARQHLNNYLDLNKTVGSYGGIYYHTLILDALKKHDAKRARHIMKEHLDNSIGDLYLDEKDLQEAVSKR